MHLITHSSKIQSIEFYWVASENCNCMNTMHHVNRWFLIRVTLDTPNMDFNMQKLKFTFGNPNINRTMLYNYTSSSFFFFFFWYAVVFGLIPKTAIAQLIVIMNDWKIPQITYNIKIRYGYYFFNKLYWKGDYVGILAVRMHRCIIFTLHLCILK